MGCNNSKDVEVQNGGVHFEVPSKAEVDSRIECSEESQSTIFGGVKVRYAFLSQRGYYPDDPQKANQDALSITTKFCGTKNDAFLGVYDGHGKHGEKCSQFCKNRLPDTIAKQIIASSKRRDSKGSVNSHEDDNATRRLHDACIAAHLHCNLALRRNAVVDDTLSGTTAISAYFHGPRARITICNVGDSRAIMGTRKKKDVEESKETKEGNNNNAMSLVAHPLSRDQTPYRKDERERVKKCGARILSLDQIEGLEPECGGDWDNDDIDLGEEIDECGDPPRVWSPYGEYPGTAFTRSIGDSIAEELGVCADPEIITREISEDDKIIVLASDGVFEFLTNQSVIDICAKFQDPLEACRAVVAEAYELWLQYELRTDDITIICIFVDGRIDETKGGDYLSTSVQSSGVGSVGGTDVLTPAEMYCDLVPVADSRPVRTLPSKASLVNRISKKNMRLSIDFEDDEEDTLDLSSLVTPKTDEEKNLIGEAIKASVMFRNLSPEQRELIYDVMEPIPVKAGDWVIKQGSSGDKYYIVDNGTFEVRIIPEDHTGDPPADGGHVVHVYVGSREEHAHPSFGELALMHSAPRAASIIAITDGHLWALHRSAFRRVLKTKTERKGLMRALRKAEPLKCLTNDEVETLANCAEEVNYAEGDEITKQGDMDYSFYFIVNGELDCKRTQNDDNGQPKTESKTLHPNNYFGAKTLFGEQPCSFTATAKSPTKCFKLKKSTIDEMVRGFDERRERFEQR